ncbi:TraR/DksA C4-type zinc finger protein [Clostridium amazonitimonense]|uniref:TraR/DksA C4-type zinc finger protein n=1 Tax=Clostridium amazonitimonense TaxID=1499689 RepID=UPI000509868E|nr:TraR/DksA C4-type zinc finger protein [Clostridium amazonitimonense]
MDKKLLEYYRKKLLRERESILDVIHGDKEMELTNSREEFSSELSFYDNHPADQGSEMNDIMRGKALKENEISLINKIDKALTSIDNKEYGICKHCGKNINKERLEVVPYAIYCVDCQNEISVKEGLKGDISINSNRDYDYRELNEPYGLGYKREDAMNQLQSFNKIKNLEDYYEEDDDENDYEVEWIEKISNQQYKAGLPD